jgi:hypothetical protein
MVWVWGVGSASRGIYATDWGFALGERIEKDTCFVERSMLKFNYQR